MSVDERSEESAGAIHHFPSGLFEPAAHGHEPHQHTQELGQHPMMQLQGYTRNGVYTLQPKDDDVWTLLEKTYAIDEQHVVNLSDMR